MQDTQPHVPVQTMQTSAHMQIEDRLLDAMKQALTFRPLHILRIVILQKCVTSTCQWTVHLAAQAWVSQNFTQDTTVSPGQLLMGSMCILKTSFYLTIQVSQLQTYSFTMMARR